MPRNLHVVLDRSQANGEAAPDPIRVLVANGHTLVRAGYRVLLEAQEPIAVTAEAADGEQAVALAGEVHPDVVLIDLSLPGIGGLEATRRILAQPELQDVRVLIVAAGERDEDALAALRAGATGFLFDDTEPSELVHAVRVVASGEALLSPGVTRRLIAELASQPDPQAPSPEQLEELTEREREVVALVATGLTNGEIAEQLVVSPATAKTHVSRAMMKLHARHRAQLVVLAYETGLVRPRPGQAPATPGTSAPVPALAVA